MVDIPLLFSKALSDYESCPLQIYYIVRGLLMELSSGSSVRDFKVLLSFLTTILEPFEYS